MESVRLPFNGEKLNKGVARLFNLETAVHQAGRNRPLPCRAHVGITSPQLDTPKGSGRFRVMLCMSRASEKKIPSKSPLGTEVWQLYKDSSHVRPRANATSVFLSLPLMKIFPIKNPATIMRVI